MATSSAHSSREESGKEKATASRDVEFEEIGKAKVSGTRTRRGWRIPVLENVSCRVPSSAAVSTTSSWFYDVLLESKGAFYPSALLRCKKKTKKANRDEAIKRTEPRENSGLYRRKEKEK